MSEIPEGIPRDVWDAAIDAFNNAMASVPPGEVVSMIDMAARAILAERERAAKVAESDADWTEFSRRPKTNWKGDQTNVFTAPGDEHLPTPANVFAYTTGIAAGRAIAAAIRNP